MLTTVLKMPPSVPAASNTSTSENFIRCQDRAPACAPHPRTPPSRCDIGDTIYRRPTAALTPPRAPFTSRHSIYWLPHRSPLIHRPPLPLNIAVFLQHITG